MAKGFKHRVSTFEKLGQKGPIKDGHGTMTWANGNKYVGAWKNHKRDGQGTMTCSNGNKYVGA
jgi:hypothetical protein